MKILFFALVLLCLYTIPVLACDCDTAYSYGISHGMTDRLRQPWPDDPQLKQQKPQKDERQNPPQQDTEPKWDDGQKQEIKK